MPRPYNRAATPQYTDSTHTPHPPTHYRYPPYITHIAFPLKDEGSLPALTKYSVCVLQFAPQMHGIHCHRSFVHCKLSHSPIPGPGRTQHAQTEVIGQVCLLKKFIPATRKTNTRHDQQHEDLFLAARFKSTVLPCAGFTSI